MNYNRLEKYFSKRRLNYYENHCKNDKNKAILLYKANLRLSRAYYPILSILEISLRNSINDIFVIHFADSDWLLNQRTGFMTRIRDNRYMIRSIDAAIDKLTRAGKAITNDRIVAELSFGFWTSFFNRNPFRELRSIQRNALPNLPVATNRTMINNQINDIRDFRNKIYHNETICFIGGVFDLSKAEENYGKIKDTLNWLDPIYKKWISDIDEVPYEFERIKHCANNTNAIKFYFNINKIRVNRAIRKLANSHLLYKQTT